MSDQKPIKLCAVCGDKALAKNFGALTCKSCKPFFRRNANKSDLFVCKNGGKCSINIKTRKKCRKCRLEKCYFVGMRKELIMSEVEKQFRRTLVEENRKRKNCLNKMPIITYEMGVNMNEDVQELNETLSYLNIFEWNSSSDDSDTNLDLSGLDLSDIESFELNFNTESQPVFDSYDIIIANNTLVTQQDLLEVEELIRFDEFSGSSVDRYKPTLEFRSQDPAIPRAVTYYENNFTQTEDFKLMELFEVLRPLDFADSVQCGLQYEIGTVGQLIHLVNTFYEKGIINLVNSIKKINVFHDICENDRIALIKYSCLDILMLRTALLYDTNEEAWTIPLDQNNSFILKMDFLRVLANDNYRTYKNHLMDIINECNHDIVVIDLLTAIALFDPNRPNILNRQIIEAQQRVYLYLLQRYLVFKFRSKPESEAKFMKLLNTLIFSHILGEWEKKYFVEDYSDGYCPLVKEIFDINYCKPIEFQLA